MPQSFNPASTTAFSKDQRVHFKADYYDTPYSYYSEGLIYALFSDFTPPSGTTPTQAAVEATLDAATSVLGTSGGNYREGRIPVIHQYWGSGAPTGVTSAQNTAMKFSGFAKKSGDFTLVFSGRGKVAVYVNGTIVGTVGNLNEATNSLELRTQSQLEAQAGYVIRELSLLSAGDQIDIYYWQNAGEHKWGGISCKVLAGPLTYSRDSFFADLRKAPVLGSSFLGAESGGANLTSTELPYLISADLDHKDEGVSVLNLTVSLSPSSAYEGLKWDANTRSLVDILNPAETFKEERLIEFSAGYVDPGTQKDASGNFTSPEIYPRFTGHIKEISVANDGQTAVLSCESLEAMLLDVHDEILPDRIAYHSNGFLYREGFSEPVYPIPAFDNWPIEVMISECCYRGGIDPYRLGKDYGDDNPPFARRSAYTNTTNTELEVDKYFKVRGLDGSKYVSIERNANYGNYGLLKKDYLPDDDPYLFKADVTQRLFDRITQVTEQYGYECYFNTVGQLTVKVRNNPDGYQSFEDSGEFSGTEGRVNAAQGAVSIVSTNTNFGSLTATTDTAAIGGTYLQGVKGTAAASPPSPDWSKEIVGEFSRLDLFAGISTDGAIIDVVAEVWDGFAWQAHSTATVDTSTDVSLGYTDPRFVYDSINNVDGSNAAIITCFADVFDRYRVTLSGSSGDPATARYDLNGLAVYFQDPDISAYPTVSSTVENALSQSFSTDKREQVNHVVVVGNRKATVTDSTKFLDPNTSTDNNPSKEFHIAIATDAYSIYDHTADNYVGKKNMAVVFDEKVTDTDFANWLAQTILYRYRFPNYAVSVSHTALPMMDLRDPFAVTDPRNSLVTNQVFWVSGVKESWMMDKATSTITLSGLPEIPSYQPREDVDVDTLFPDTDDNGRGDCIANMDIRYQNIYGQSVGIAELSHEVGDANIFISEPTSNSRAVDGGGDTEPAISGLIPESVFLHGIRDYTGVSADDKPTSFPKDRILVNNPYQKFWDISFTGGGTEISGTIDYDFEVGDGSAGVYDKAYYRFPSGASYSYNLHYKTFATRTNALDNNPFYDPYSSEVGGGNFVDVSFDALVGGRYRVSIWHRESQLPVAWLTNPSGAPDDPEQHWQFLEPKSDITFTWDGVDNIGVWNTTQSSDYDRDLEGAFGENEPTRIASGFYAWNDSSSSMIQIGDNLSTGENKDSVTGLPHYTIGQYADFYVRVETLNDTLYQKDRQAGYTNPRTVESDNLPQSYHPGSAGSTRANLSIYYHLPEPSQVTISSDIWTNASDWTYDTTLSTWSAYSPGVTDFRNGKPVRFTFTPVKRRGHHFTNTVGPQVKLTRKVDLKTVTFDQFWTFFNRDWDDVATQENGNESQVTSRMYHNTDHSLEWKDDQFRTGEQISTTWIFQPEMFVKDFGNGYVEELRYGDYSQLEEVPGANNPNIGGYGVNEEAYLNLAYMAYLFYFSAFTLDRSGRRQWCLNDSFVDKSKIVTSTYADTVSYPTNNAAMDLRRSMFVRQWKDTDWASGGSRTPLSPIARGFTVNAAHIQPNVSDFDPVDGSFDLLSPIAGQVGADKWLTSYSTDGSAVNKVIHNKHDDNDTSKVHNQEAQSLNFQLESFPNAGGSWLFQHSPHGNSDWFFPSPPRDFHPYFKYPLMPDSTVAYTYHYHPDDATGNQAALKGRAIGVLESTSSNAMQPLRDPAAQDNWYGFAYKYDYAEGQGTPNNYHGARLEMSVVDWASEKDREGELKEVFNYIRQDNLDRFDQFRGVFSRGSYGDRSQANASYDNPDRRIGYPTPVRPSGVLLLNLGRYDEYIGGWPAPSQDFAFKLRNFVNRVRDWFYIRFRHEYVWYSARPFPVARNGATLYQYTGDEFTDARELAYTPNQSDFPTDYAAQVVYDNGAWTGWKDDVDPTLWQSASSTDRLRWRYQGVWGGPLRDLEERDLDGNVIGVRSVEGAGTSEFPMPSGGIEHVASGDSGGQAESGSAGTSPFQDYFFDVQYYYYHANILDSSEKGPWIMPRLAVSQELPESEEVSMILVLPPDLR